MLFHVGLRRLGHPHEPQQAQPQGPQQVIDILENINLRGNFHGKMDKS